MDRGGERRDRQRVPLPVGDVGPGGAERVVRAERVDLQRPLEDLRVPAEQRELRRDAGVRDDDVQAAETRDEPGDGVVDLRPVTHVADLPRSIAAARGDLLEQLGLEARDGDLRAARVQAARERGADAARAAGDQDAGHVRPLRQGMVRRPTLPSVTTSVHWSEGVAGSPQGGLEAGP